MDNVSKRAFHLLEHLNDLSKEERAEELKKLGKTLNDNNKHGAEKVSLANSTYNTVCFLTLLLVHFTYYHIYIYIY